METNPFFEDVISRLIEQEWAVVPFFFDEQTLTGLRLKLHENMETGALRSAGIGNKSYHAVNDAIRTDKILWLETATADPSEKAFMQRIGEFCAYMNATCFTGIRSWEFHYACFEKGAFYKKHLDRFKTDDARKFSVVTYINESWTEADGGQLALYLPEETIRVLPEFGTTVIFKSDRIEHEVLPAGRDRLSITGWLR